MALETETIKAVPTPRFDVGEKALAAQLLCKEIQKKLRDATPNVHDEGKQTIIPPNHQKKRKVRSADRFLNRCSQNDVSDKGHGTRPHDVIPSVFRLVTVPCLEEHHEPTDSVRSYCHSLSVDRRESEVAD